VNADASVNSADVVALVGKLNTYGGKTKTIPSSNTNFSLCGDANIDGSNTSADVVKIVGWLNTYGGKTKTVACPHTYN
jgi:predicted fused transcriptional regulator/phosphomethylpyrimidine kinase